MIVWRGVRSVGGTDVDEEGRSLLLVVVVVVVIVVVSVIALVVIIGASLGAVVRSL